jgi:uncharacterized protein (TIGR02001 family)
MRLTRHSLGTAVLACLWSSAAAAAAVDLSGELGVVSDYRYRGISLSRGNPAIQASISLEHGSGAYANLWGSTLGHAVQAEVDLTAGYETKLSDQLGVDFSGTYFVYPSGGGANYFEGTAVATATHGAASASLGASYVPAQRGTRDETGGRHRNLYAFVRGAFAIPKTPVTLSLGLGRERGCFDEVERGGKWDWKAGAEAQLSSAKLGLAYVGSNADGGDRHALVASLSLNW